MIRFNESQADGDGSGLTLRSTEPPTRVYHTDEIAVEWHGHRCTHSGRCILALPQVFNPQQRPWIDIEGADSESIARAVLGCPSGALQLVRPSDATPSQLSAQYVVGGASRLERNDDDF